MKAKLNRNKYFVGTKKLKHVKLYEEYKLNEDKQFDYMLLDRLRSDCEYFLGNGNRSERRLWAGSVDAQIEKMKELWNKLDPKPEWLSMEEILDYEKKMKNDKVEEAAHDIKHKKYNDVVDKFNELVLPKDVFLNGKKYTGECKVINGYNGYESTPTDGLLGVFDPVEKGRNVWNGFRGYLQDSEGNYLRAKERRDSPSIEIK